MKQSPQQADNRTGFMRSGRLGEQMLEATREFLPSSSGSAQAIADVRIAYAREAESLGEAPLAASLVDKAKSVLPAVTGDQLIVLLDKLSERLMFEHAGARLYEAVISKHEAYGSFEGGPSGEDLLHILQEEYEHGDMLQQAIKELGGDPTAVTPSANLAMNISAGLPQVLSDPRTNLLQSLEAIVVAELADNECWSALEQLARQAGHDELADECREAIEHEREHLQNVRLWIAAGQGREMVGETGAPPPGGADVEFTVAAEATELDLEGDMAGEEEAAERGEAAPPKSGKGKASGRKRSEPRGE